MPEHPRTHPLFDALVDLVSRAAREFPAATESLREQVGAAVASGSPDAWQRAAVAAAAWAASAAGEEQLGDHPIVSALKRAAADVLAVLVQAAEGDAEAGDVLDGVVMPWLERLSAACVDAMMSKK